MANLTVEQPSIKVLKVEINHGVKRDRTANGSAEDWSVTESQFWGAKAKYYTPKDGSRSILDHIDSDYKPYCVAITCLIESPMKMFVQN